MECHKEEKGHAGQPPGPQPADPPNGPQPSHHPGLLRRVRPVQSGGPQGFGYRQLESVPGVVCAGYVPQ